MVAAYERIRTDLAEQISSGALGPGDRLPSEAELARRYGVAHMTVRHAIEHLAREGLLYRRWGVGTFVAEERPAYRSFNRLQGFGEELAAEGRVLSSKVLVQELAAPPPPPAVAERLELAEDASVVHLERIRFLDDRPVAFQQSWVPGTVCPSLSRIALVDGSLYATLTAEAGISLASAVQTIVPVAAGRSEAAALALRRGAPILRVERVTRETGGRVVEYARSWTVADLPIVMRLTVEGSLEVRPS